MNKLLVGSLMVTTAAIVGIILLLQSFSSGPTPTPALANVSMLNGKQMIQITAKGGYTPRTTNATANTPTEIDVTTNGTYDCSAALSIPAIGYREILPPSGLTAIQVPPQAPGTTLKGVCEMGMYSFRVTFN